MSQEQGWSKGKLVRVSKFLVPNLLFLSTTHVFFHWLTAQRFALPALGRGTAKPVLATSLIRQIFLIF